MTRTTLRSGGILVALSIGATVVFAQAAPPAQERSELGELIAEVRGLRADMNQVAGSSIRMQVLVARLSLQEQRIATLSRQATDLGMQLAAAARERIEVAERVANFETASTDADTPLAVRRDLENALPREKSDLERRQQREQQLRTQESDLLGAIAAEQGRWQEFNNRLDELERSLPMPR